MSIAARLQEGWSYADTDKKLSIDTLLLSATAGAARPKFDLHLHKVMKNK